MNAPQPYVILTYLACLVNFTTVSRRTLEPTQLPIQQTLLPVEQRPPTSMCPRGKNSWSYTTRYGLEDPRIEYRRVKFYATFQTGPEAYPAFYKIRIMSISRAKWLERGVDHPPI